jgi:hypothetical protein
MSINAATGLISWTPATGQTGPQSVTVRATDAGGLFATQAYSISVTGANTAPTALNDGYNPDQTFGVSVVAVAAPGVLANDTDPDGPQALTAQLVSESVPGTLTLNANGAFSYQPGSSVGTFTFRYRAFDGLAQSGTATVSVTREIRVTKIEYRRSVSRWTVEGRSALPGSTITVYFGATTGGTVLGTTTVRTDGTWTFSRTGGVIPVSGDKVSVDNTLTTGGAVLSAPVTIK